MQVEAPEGPGVGNEYDAAGQLVAVDYGGAESSFGYNYAGMKTSMDDAQQVALRSAGTLLWLTGDHLGSTTVTADASGGSATTQLYKAWGEIRTGSLNALVTRYTFTGQAAEDSLGLMFYRARWYDPLLGRFISADSIVPNAYDPLAHDRYAYVRSNPVRYTDPSGHNWRCGPDGVFCDNDEWNNYYFDAVGLSDAENLIISIARQLEQLIGTSVTLSVRKYIKGFQYWPVYFLRRYCESLF